MRCIGEPDRRFEEDSLRLMRAVRFAVTREVQVEKETCSSIFRNAPLLARISPERIREELDIPVFDFNSMIGHVAMALSLVKLY